MGGAGGLIYKSTYEADAPFAVSLKEAFEVLEPQLRPPFPLKLPTDEEYLRLNRAILYGILCEPHFSKVHIKHLHAIITDGYTYFTCILGNLVDQLYPKLVDSVKSQLIWLAYEMINVLAVGFDGFLVSLMRQIVGGDFSEGNLWLAYEIINLFSAKWDCLREEAPLILTSALYTFLRLLADHFRLPSDSKMESLKRREIDFCVRMLRKEFLLCFKVGRDLVRLLHDVFHVPEFRAIWKDLISNPRAFDEAGFQDISQLYHSDTPSRYFLLRITPEMEKQLRFLLTHVKLGNQKRYQLWFTKKFLLMSERESLLVDIVRFICCAHHPSNDVIQSDIIPRWAVIGWLLKSCRKKYVEANVKLALFYDWLFFDEKTSNIMNIEPSILLMAYSIPKYIDVTHTLLDFLFLLVDNYDIERKDAILKGVSTAMNVLVRKGVVQSLGIFTNCHMLSSFLKESLEKLSVGMQEHVAKELPISEALSYSASVLELNSSI